MPDIPAAPFTPVCRPVPIRSGLPPSNTDGVGAASPASFSFTVKPFFYQTYWFYIVVVLFILVSGFLFHQFRIRRLRAVKKELATQVEERTRDLKKRNIQLENAHEDIRKSKELIESKSRQVEEQAEKLKELDNVKSRFFANISHEFRTPLTLIMGPLEKMIEESPPDEPETKKKYTMMLRNGQRLLRLINQLLDLSKLSSGKMTLTTWSTDIVGFVKGIAASFRLLSDQKELQLVIEVQYKDGTPGDSPEIPVYIDIRKMEDVMSNLLINALKFTPEGGRVIITITQYAEAAAGFPSGRVEMSVRDTGPGIPQWQLEHVFDRFYQADTTHELHRKGSGIGLSLSRELVELHHGTIDVTSEVGKGTEFIVTLPMGTGHLEPEEITEQPQAQETSGPSVDSRMMVPELIESNSEATHVEQDAPDDSETENESGDKKDIILVVEDSADLRAYIRSSLEPEYTVIEAVNGLEGIEKARKVIPDLIISDVMMPEADGYEVCRVLKGDVNTSHIPIILLTAKASEGDILEGLETGANDYVTKPFNSRILNARIKNLIQLRRHFQQTFSREMSLQPVEMPVSKVDQEFIKDLRKVVEENFDDPDFNVDVLSEKLYMGRSSAVS